MQALFIFGCWLSLIALGCVAPFVMALAFIWVDLFRPQDVVPVLAPLLPFSMTTAVLTVGAYLVLDRRDPPRLGLLTVLLVVWAAWITLTTTWPCTPSPPGRNGIGPSRPSCLPCFCPSCFAPASKWKRR